ncbi:cache domain-containing protein [Petroclostridium sp. X23]|uniref:HAMP domain-containing protein n=1 Tax=Petroclostridium sp. X23 TaxID=3045146 RepID=UPI0024AD3DDE|nr:cache domain-containing protein [Petroclostridium sp. X23]WHH58072.1 cache domain-containing protein [Petroclostridium sp. X23]
MKSIYNWALKFFKFGSIQSNIAGVFSFLILFSIIYIGFITYKVSSDVVEKNTREYMNELIRQVNINIETYITYMENISLVALNNKDIGLYFSNNNFSKEEKENSKNKIIELFDSILYARTDIASISIFGYDGNFISDSENSQINEFADIKGQSWYENAVKANGQIAISSSHVQNIISNKYRWVVSLSRELRSKDGKEKLGIFLADLNFKVINDICSKVKLGKRGYIFIIDNDGKIVFHPQQQLLYSNLKSEIIDEVLNTKENSFIIKDGKDSRIYTIQTSDYSGWKIVGVAYVDELFANKKRIYTYYALGGIVFVTIVVLLSILLSLRISKPVKLLESSMKEVQKGNFDIKVDIKDPEEIKKLSKAFNYSFAENSWVNVLP